jgi:hypothetical protein
MDLQYEGLSPAQGGVDMAPLRGQHNALRPLAGHECAVLE